MNTPINKRTTRSIRTRIWQGIAVTAAATSATTAASYFAVWSLTSDPAVSVLTSIGLSAVIVILLGRQLVQRIAGPVDAVNLAAKTSERNPSISVPLATGVLETDELLQSLHRFQRQLLSFSSSMEMAAAGKIDRVVLPDDSPDRLTKAFQILVQKIAESVNAKNELNDLQQAIKELEDQLSWLVETKRYRKVRSSGSLVRVADALDQLAIRAHQELRAANNGIAEIQPVLLSASLNVRNGLLASEASQQNLSRAVASLKSTPDHVKEITEAYEPVTSAAEKAASSLPDGIIAGKALADTMALLQRNHSELSRKLRKLRDRSQSLTDAARSVEDLARRSNLIALNTTIQADGRSDSTALGNEFLSISDRASRAHKQISDIERSLDQEIEGTDSLVRFLLNESVEVGLQLTALLELIEQFEPIVNGYNGVPERVLEIAVKAAQDREALTRSVSSCYFDVEKIAPLLHETEHAIGSVRIVIENLSSGSHHDRSPAEDNYEAVSAAGRPALELTGEN